MRLPVLLFAWAAGCSFIYDDESAGVECSLGGELLALPLDGEALAPRGSLALSISVQNDSGRRTEGACGGARSFQMGEFIEIGHLPQLELEDVAVELLARFPRNDSLLEREMGILTKDGTGTNDGDFQVIALYPEGASHPNILMRLQTESGSGGSLWLCTEGAVEADAWHSIAVAIGADLGAELFVDGAPASGDTTHRRPSGELAVCGARDTTWQFRGWLNNSQELVLGASNAGSGAVSKFLAGGTLDHVRIAPR